MAQEQDSKEGLLLDLQVEWERLVASLEGLTEVDLLEPGVVGPWSIKDLQGHISSWEEEVIDMLRIQLSGQEANFAPHVVDEWNALQVEGKNSIPLQEIQTAFHETHQRLAELASQLPDELFHDMTRIRLALEADAWGHYVEHRSQVEAWRQGRLELEP